MEGLVRHLRDGAIQEDGAAALAIICDTLGVVGGPALFKQALVEYCKAVEQMRAQAHTVRMACLTAEGLAISAEANSACSQQLVSIIDLCSDPWGWLKDDPCEPSAEDMFSAATAPTSKAAKRSTCLAIDCLSTLINRHGLSQALCLLHRLQRHPNISCILMPLHEDLHNIHMVQSMHSLASAVVQLSSASPLQAQVVGRVVGRPVMGKADFRYRRRAGGRVKVEQSFYSVDAQGRAHVFAPPPEATALTAQTVLTLAAQQAQGRQDTATEAAMTAAAAAAAAAGKGALSQQSQQGGGAGTSVTLPGGGHAAAAGCVQLQPRAESGGRGGEEGGSAPAASAAGLSRDVGMRLTLTEEERQAKEAVVLPYQHAGTKLHTADFREYLPPAAGGRGAAAGGSGANPNRLGHILYVRDSEGEADSDEDPDDDLDI